MSAHWFSNSAKRSGGMRFKSEPPSAQIMRVAYSANAVRNKVLSESLPDASDVDTTLADLGLRASATSFFFFSSDVFLQSRIQWFSSHSSAFKNLGGVFAGPVEEVDLSPLEDVSFSEFPSFPGSESFFEAPLDPPFAPECWASDWGGASDRY